MRKLFVAFLLLVAVAASAQSPITTSKSLNGLTFTNATGKAIILAIGTSQFPGGMSGVYVHEAFFGTTGWVSGDTETFVQDDPKEVPPIDVNFTYVQFDDGSEWGDRSTAKAALDRRAAKLKYLQTLVARAAVSEHAFTTTLADSQAEASAQHKYMAIVNTDGTKAAIDSAKRSLARAMARVNSGKF